MRYFLVPRDHLEEYGSSDGVVTVEEVNQLLRDAGEDFIVSELVIIRGEVVTPRTTIEAVVEGA